MQQKFKRCTALFVGAVALAGASAGMACTLKPSDPIRIKQMMAREIAHRLGMAPQQVPLNAITQPVLHTPFGLAADCRGIDGYHYSAAFRVGMASVPGHDASAAQPPLRWPQYAREPAFTQQGRKRDPSAGPDAADGPARWTDMGPSMGRWPQHERCAYEGVVVVLGYGYSSPVSVHFNSVCK